VPFADEGGVVFRFQRTGFHSDDHPRRATLLRRAAPLRRPPPGVPFADQSIVPIRFASKWISVTAITRDEHDRFGVLHRCDVCSLARLSPTKKQRPLTCQRTRFCVTDHPRRAPLTRRAAPWRRPHSGCFSLTKVR